MRSSLRGPYVLSSPRLFFVIDNTEWFTEVVVDNLLPGLRFSTSDGFGARFNCDSRRRRNVSMTSLTGVRCCGFPVKIGFLMGEALRQPH